MKRIMMMLGLCAFCMCCAASAEAAFEKHDWQMRLRSINVAPDESSTVSNGGEITVDAQAVPELDISYFFTDNISAELILATSKHKMGEVGPNIDLGHVWVLPPTLMAQYHFNNTAGFVPYVGAGINYTIFYNEDPGAVTSIKYKNGFGYALQFGADYKLDDHWMLNADIKKIFLNTDANVNNGAVTADVDLDPWVLGLGVGYRF
jgi:outer membrane protein